MASRAVADPRFPVGGVDPLGSTFWGKMYAKTKELGPIGGRAPGMPPRSANDQGYYKSTNLVVTRGSTLVVKAVMT